MATVTGGGVTTVINAGSNDANGVAQALANVITAGLAAGGNLTRTTGANPTNGYGVLTIATPNTSVVDQPAVAVNLIAAGGSVHGGSNVTVVGTGGPNQAVIGDNENITYFTNGGSGTLVVGDGTNLIGTPTVGGGQFKFTTGSGNDIILAMSGQNTVNAGGGSNLIFTGNGRDTILNTGGNDVVSGGGGNSGIGDTIFGGSGTMLIAEFNKNLTFVGGSGRATVLAGNGSYTIDGGTGGGLFGGGHAGNNVISSGTGSVGSTIYGGGSGDQLYARGSGTNVLVAGAGNETLVGAGSTGNNYYFSTVGNAQMFGGAGNETFFVGSGNTTVAAGTGSDNIAIQSGSAGGTVTLVNFNSADKLVLMGYGSNEQANALANQTSSGGSAQIKLSDNTTITFVGVGSVNGSSFA